MAQAELARRQRIGRGYSGNSVFSSRVVCGDCGSFYGQKVWHSTDKYRKKVWRCNRKFGGEKAKCATPTLTEEKLKAAFIQAYSSLTSDRESALSDCAVLLEMVSDCTGLDEQIAAVNEEIQVIAGLVKSCIRENATKAQSQEEYERKYASLSARYEKATENLERLQNEQRSRELRSVELRAFMDALRDAPLILDSFDTRLWTALVEKAVVHHDGRIVFQLKSGQEMEAGV